MNKVNATPVVGMFDTARIVEKSDVETFQWFRKHCFAYGALPTLKYHLHQRAGKLSDDDLFQEREYFEKQAIDLEKRRDKAQQSFQELKGKTDQESQKKLIGIVEGLSDYAEYASRAREIVDVFSNAIKENVNAAENFRKEKVGAKLKTARLQNKMTQDELGKLIGVTKATISTYESGDREPSIKNLIAIAKVLHISLDELLMN